MPTPTPTPDDAFTAFFTLIKEVITVFIKYGGLAFLAFGLIGILVWFFILRKRKRVSSLDLLKQKHTEISKREKASAYPHLKRLERVNFDMNNTPHGITPEDLKEALSNNDSVPLGEITGFNIIDLNVSAEDLIRYNTKGMKGGSDAHKAEVIKQIEKDSEETGNYLYVITYKQKLGLFKTKENLLLIFEPQMISYNDPVGGIVTVAGYGIDQMGGIDFLTGNPRLMPFALNYLKKAADIDTITGMIGDQKHMVNKSIDLDSNQAKGERMLKALGQIKESRSKKE